MNVEESVGRKPARSKGFNPSARFVRAGESTEPASEKKAKKREPAGPSLDKRFADFVLGKPGGAYAGPWACQTGGAEDFGLVRRWTGNHWGVVHAAAGQVLTSKWLEVKASEFANAKKAAALWEYFNTRLRGSHPMAPMNEDVTIVPVQNAYLLIDDQGRIRSTPPAPGYGVDFVCQTEIDLSRVQPGSNLYTPAPVPSESLFGRFLATSFPNLELRGLVQELCGQTLLRGLETQVVGWLVGSGGSGKGTLMKLVQRFHANTASVRLHKLSERFGLESLIGATLINVPEVKDAKFDEELFKSVITDPIDIERKHEKDLRSYRVRAKWLISSNEFPHITDKSDGVWRRIILVPIADRLNKGEENISLVEDIVKSELHTVLDWLLEGAVRVVKRGGFPKDQLPQIVNDQKELRKTESDSVYDWINSDQIRLCEGHEPFTKKEVVYQDYLGSLPEGRAALGDVSFWKAMRQHFPGLNVDKKVREWSEARNKIVELKLANIHIPKVLVSPSEAQSPAKVSTIPKAEMMALEEDLPF